MKINLILLMKQPLCFFDIVFMQRKAETGSLIEITVNKAYY